MCYDLCNINQYIYFKIAFILEKTILFLKMLFFATSYSKVKMTSLVTSSNSESASPLLNKSRRKRGKKYIRENKTVSLGLFMTVK